MGISVGEQEIEQYQIKEFDNLYPPGWNEFFYQVTYILVAQCGVFVIASVSVGRDSTQ